MIQELSDINITNDSNPKPIKRWGADESRKCKLGNSHLKLAADSEVALPAFNYLPGA